MTTRAQTKRLLQQIGARGAGLGLRATAEIITTLVRSVHEHIVPLRLEELCEARDVDFVHDVGGILEHIEERTLGRPSLQGFRPKFAVRGVPAK